MTSCDDGGITEHLSKEASKDPNYSISKLEILKIIDERDKEKNSIKKGVLSFQETAKISICASIISFFSSNNENNLMINDIM